MLVLFIKHGLFCFTDNAHTPDVGATSSDDSFPVEHDYVEDDHETTEYAEEEEAVIDYLESSDEEQETSNEPFSVKEAFQTWAMSTNQTYDSIEQIMGIIGKVSSCKLLKDARTLLKINRNRSSEIITVQGGQYWYRGIQNCFTNELR